MDGSSFIDDGALLSPTVRQIKIQRTVAGANIMNNIGFRGNVDKFSEISQVEKEIPVSAFRTAGSDKNHSIAINPIMIKTGDSYLTNIAPRIIVTTKPPFHKDSLSI